MAGFKLSKISAILRGEYLSTEHDEVRLAIRNIASSLADKFVQADDRFDRRGWYRACGLPSSGSLDAIVNRASMITAEPVLASVSPSLVKRGGTDSQSFAYALETKFQGERTYGITVWVKSGYKFDKIMMADGQGKNAHVHCFIEKTTGAVCKAASLNAPARHSNKSLVSQYSLRTDWDFTQAVAAADANGSYLYDTNRLR